jgi:Raf kinase inhibitor-like YbhB/YbcL family protein
MVLLSGDEAGRNRGSSMHKIIIGALTAAIVSTSTAQAADFVLTSPDIAEGQTIAADQYWNNFGCSGQNLRPVLEWSGAPAGTKSYAVTFYDNDAPTGSGFWHWVVYDIPADSAGIAADALPVGAIEGNTDVGVPGYAGPCPPVGRTHNYTFTVHALGVDALEGVEGATAPLTGFFINANSLGSATLNVVAGPRSE